MKNFGRALAACSAVAILSFTMVSVRAADVRGYSVLKGEFLNQTGPTQLVTDPDFGFSLLVSVDLTDFNLATNDSFRGPSGVLQALDDLGDSWDYLDSHDTFSSLNSAHGWGNYTLNFETVNDGQFSCVLILPNTPLPPTPRLLNFDDVQTVNPAKPLALSWDFSAPPNPTDFVQVYVNFGHSEVFSTPNLGEPGALSGTARSVTIPVGTLAPGLIYGLNLEITRLTSTNSVCYPAAEGVVGTFRSTSNDLTTIVLPELQLLSRPTNGVISLAVFTEPGKTVVLQSSEDLTAWGNRATNATASGSNSFLVPLGAQVRQFFRAWHQ